MKIMNIGSINIDHLYKVPRFVRPGETLKSENYTIFSGGKGANQSIALAHAGAAVMHAGKISSQDGWLKEKLKNEGVDVSLIESGDTPTGHAIIQVTPEGENAIIIHGGANESFTKKEIDTLLDQTQKGDYLLLQNEINLVDTIICKASTKKVTIIFNPAPMSDEVHNYSLELVDIFIINEVEGAALTGETTPDAIADQMMKLYPESRTVLTLGTEGVLYADRDRRLKVEALKVEAVDTTGAGDTFIGYFVAELSRGSEIEKCLELGVKASALCVTREGAGDSIPMLREIR